MRPHPFFRWAAATAAIATAALVMVGTPTSAQRTLTEIPNPAAALELAALRPAEGFEINLFASEPQLAKPIHMNFDAAGRLWVVGSSLYPQIRPGVQPVDKIFVLEDTNGDGRADQSTVFADKLLIPTGIAPDDTVPHLAAYVASSSELLYLEDTNGDNVADRTTVVLSGFGTEDTHHLIHSFRWGPSGQLFFNQSLYIYSHVETPWGVRRLSGGGVWQFDPRHQKLDIFTRGGINMWGHHVDAYGQSFLTDGAFTEGIYHGYPGATFATAIGADRILRGMNPGQPKQSGLEIASGRHLPEAWQGRFLTNDFRGNRTYSFNVEDSGSGYISKQGEDLVSTSHVAYRPVDVKMGPDGAIYIADWYNPIIQHGEVDFRDPRRDVQHGRIWRVAARGRPLVSRPQLESATVQELIAALEAPELYTRERARPVLARHGAAAVLPALRTWASRLDPAHPDQARLLLEALWVCQWLDAPEPSILQRALSSTDFRVRAGAVRTAGEWASRLDDSLTLLSRAATDTNPRVRLEAVNGLRALGTAEAARAATTVADLPLDTNLGFALQLTMRELAPVWLPRVEADPTFFGPDPARLISALSAVNRPEAVRPLVTLWRTGRIPDAQQQAAVELMARAGGAAEMRLLFDLALESTTAGSRVSMLEALTRAAEERQVRPSGPLASVSGLVTGGDESLRAAALRLAGAWQLVDLRTSMTDSARSDNAAIRSAALRALADLGPSSRADLTALAASGAAGRRVEAVAALARIDAVAAAGLAVGLLVSADANIDATAVATAFLAREDGPAALAQALAGRTIAAGPARALLRGVSSAGRALPDLVKAVETAAGLDPIVGMPRGEALASLIGTVRTAGNRTRGEDIYRRPALACTACHAIGGAGGKAGPDLLSLGASAPLDYIVEALLEPQASIKEGYEVTTVTRTDGGITAGILVRESDQELIIRDAANTEHRVPVGQVQSRTQSPISLMPPGLTASLREDELVDVLAFLSSLGREMTVPAEPYVRRYALLEGGPTLGAILREHGGISGAAIDPDVAGLTWHEVYARVDGSLPTDVIPSGSPNISFDGAQLRLARFELDVQRAGTVALAIDDPLGLIVYVGRERIHHVGTVTTFELPAGRHNVSVVITLRDYAAAENNRPSNLPLRIGLTTPPANAAQVQVVNSD